MAKRLYFQDALRYSRLPVVRIVTYLKETKSNRFGINYELFKKVAKKCIPGLISREQILKGIPGEGSYAVSNREAMETAFEYFSGSGTNIYEVENFLLKISADIVIKLPIVFIISDAKSKLLRVAVVQPRKTFIARSNEIAAVLTAVQNHFAPYKELSGAKFDYVDLCQPSRLEGRELAVSRLGVDVPVLSQVELDAQFATLVGAVHRLRESGDTIAQIFELPSDMPPSG